MALESKRETAAYRDWIQHILIIAYTYAETDKSVLVNNYSFEIRLWLVNFSNILAFSREFDFGLNRVLVKTNLSMDKLYDPPGIDIPTLNKTKHITLFF